MSDDQEDSSGELNKKLSAECEVLKKRLEDALSANTTMKKENSELKGKIAESLTPAQIQRLKNDNKRLLGLTERINSQRSRIEENLKEKKQDIVDLETELGKTKEQLDNVITDRNKIKQLVENLLGEIEKLRNEIKVLKDGKSFGDFVELKRQIKELKEENTLLSQGLTSDQKGLKLNLNDLATMLHLKQGDTLDSISHRAQYRRHTNTWRSKTNQRVVVLDERELEESIKNRVIDERPPCCQELSPPRTPHPTSCICRPLTSRTSSVNRINFISPPCTLVTSPRTYSRQASRERRKSKASSDNVLPGVGLGAAQTHFIVRRRSSPRWPSLSELNERYQFALQGAWTAKPSIEEVSEYMKKRQSTTSLNANNS